MKGVDIFMSTKLLHGQMSVVDENGDVSILHQETSASDVLVDIYTNTQGANGTPAIPDGVDTLQKLSNNLGELAFKSVLDATNLDGMIANDFTVETSGKVLDARAGKNLNDRLSDMEEAELLALGIEEEDSTIIYPESEINDDVTSKALTWSSEKIDSLTLNFYIPLVHVSDNNYTSETPVEKIEEAYQHGKRIWIVADDLFLPLTTRTNANEWIFSGYLDEKAFDISLSPNTVTFTYKEVATMEDRLPNPNVLKLTGVVNAVYDGSTEVEVVIPEIVATEEISDKTFLKWSSESNKAVASALKEGTGKDSLIIGEGVASGVGSIAGGTTDKEMIEGLVGSLASNIVKLNPSEAVGALAISLGADNKANTGGSVALGYDNISGGKGYYFDNFDGKTITLSTTRRATTLVNPTYPSSVNWAVGDRLFMVNDDRYWLTITAVSGNKITVAEDIGSVNYSATLTVFTYSKPNDRTIINIDKPESGVVDIGWGAFGIGSLNTVVGSNAYAVGYKNIIAGDFGTAFGQENLVGYSAFATGIGNKALGRASHAEGDNTTAEGAQSHTEGAETLASGKYSHAEGSDTIASGKSSHAEGRKVTKDSTEYIVTASGLASHAEGGGTVATGDYSHSENYITQASGKYSHAEGWGTKATNNGAHAEGDETVASGKYSHTEGGYTEAQGYYSHAEGDHTIASGDYSHAEGGNTVASNLNAHAEGQNTTASGKHSHAEGADSVASGNIAHVEGFENTAEGAYSHAGGWQSKATHDGSFVHGRKLTTTRDYQVIFGEDNQDNPDALLIVGKGDHTQGNAFEVLAEGSIKVGSTTLTEAQLIKILNFIDTIEG